MSPRAGILTFLFLIISTIEAKGSKELGLLAQLEDKIESKLCEYAMSATGWLEKFNDNHLGKSELGRFLHYEEFKSKVPGNSKLGRNIKKLSMAMMPLIFQVGATSTWMLLTTLLTAKSVAIGLVLLVFKIAVSSAKLGSFFTQLKAKTHHEWVPHYEHHHGHERSLSKEHHSTYLDHPPSHDWSYSPEWTPADLSHYSAKSLATYQENEPYTKPDKAEDKLG